MAAIRARVAPGHALFHQRGESPDEIHVGFPRYPVEGVGDFHQLSGRKRRTDRRHGADGYPLVDHRDAVFVAYVVAGADQVLRKPQDAVADALLESLDVVPGAFKQVDAQRDGANIQVLVSEHFKCGKDLSLGLT